MPHTQIHVLFVEADTGNMLADALMPADQLPPTFAVETIMHLREADWKVVEADPLTADEYTRAGKLVLIVQKVSSASLPENL